MYLKLRLSPPLTITQEELWQSCQIINDLFEKLEEKFSDFHPTSDTYFNFPPPGAEAIIALQERTNVLNKSAPNPNKQPSKVPDDQPKPVDFL